MPGSGVVVVGLETVRGPEALAEIVEEAGARSGSCSASTSATAGPSSRPDRPRGTDRPPEIASRAVGAGATKLIHLDLAHVGTGRSVDALGSFSGLIATTGPAAWIVGRGIARAHGDLDDLARAGASGVLIGSALHDGRIGAADLAARAGRLAR